MGAAGEVKPTRRRALPDVRRGGPAGGDEAGTDGTNRLVPPKSEIWEGVCGCARPARATPSGRSVPPPRCITIVLFVMRQRPLAPVPRCLACCLLPAAGCRCWRGVGALLTAPLYRVAVLLSGVPLSACLCLRPVSFFSVDFIFACHRRHSFFFAEFNTVIISIYTIFAH